jgi:hypothetical protein
LNLTTQPPAEAAYAATSNPYYFAAFVHVILRRSVSETPSKSRAMLSRECGQVESVCG